MDSNVVHNTPVGSITINNDAICSIVSMSVNEVSGIAGFSRGFYDKIKNKITSDKTRGVRVEISDDKKITITIGVYVDYGVKVAEVVVALQRHVKEAVEKMVENEVVAVNIDIDGVKFLKE
ncbi:MAG: Asp23/Gls24 family envelope stress response protein [Bacillota bacterium]